MLYTYKTLKRKAQKVGYVIKKGYMRTKAVPSVIAEATPGYTVYGIVDNRKDLYMVYGDSELYFNLLSLEEVEDFLKEAYQLLGLEF